MNLCCRKAWSSFFDQKSADPVFAPGPHYGDIRYAAVGDPSFFAIQDPCVPIATRPRQHARWVGTEAGFRQPKAANRFA